MGAEKLNVTPLTPVAGLFIVCSLIGALLVQVDPQGLLWRYLLYMPYPIEGTALIYENQYWRLLTPMFLHFGLPHIVFNCLLLWILGIAIEERGGSVRLLLLLLCCGVVSNMAQYVYTHHPFFGGMSGAVYGLIAYIIVVNKCSRHNQIAVPPALLWVTVVSMLLGFTGILDYIFGISIANWAHLSGFIAGIVLGIVDCIYQWLYGRYIVRR